jgi:hypothetical protein
MAALRSFTKPAALTVFVLGHQRRQFAAIGEAPHLRRVYLHDISFRERRLAESRIFLGEHLLRCRAEHIGLASASWNWKYNGHTVWHGRRWPHCLGVEQLDQLDLSPGVVWAAAPTTCDGATGQRWSIGLDRIFPGIYPLVVHVARHFGLRHLFRHSLLANNFVAHRSTVRALTHFMRSAIGWLDAKYGPAWPIKPDRCGMFADRLPAFMGEALSLLFWANQTDLEIRQIPSP